MRRSCSPAAISAAAARARGAVWAIQQQGIRAVLAPSFGDIFFNNCFQNGVLPVTLAEAAIQIIARQVEADPARNLVTVDLAREVVTAPDGTETAFRIDPLRREALLEGLDDIALTQQNAARRWRNSRRATARAGPGSTRSRT